MLTLKCYDILMAARLPAITEMKITYITPSLWFRPIKVLQVLETYADLSVSIFVEKFQYFTKTFRRCTQGIIGCLLYMHVLFIANNMSMTIIYISCS